ncbi:hypothetical protein GCM10010353_00340 [Streptomyces chryseus]|nr:hypothetical protein GCM10010353_00340 [Streptomyces chryseus]
MTRCRPVISPSRGPGAEPGGDVEAGRHAVEHDAGEQQRDPARQGVHLGHEGERAVHRDADHHDVGDGAEPGAMAHRDPQQQDGGADGDGDHADRQPGLLGQALMQHPPGLQAEPRPDQHRRTHSVQRETDVQLRQPTREFPGHVVLPG